MKEKRCYIGGCSKAAVRRLTVCEVNGREPLQPVQAPRVYCEDHAGQVASLLCNGSPIVTRWEAAS